MTTFTLASSSFACQAGYLSHQRKEEKRYGIQIVGRGEERSVACVLVRVSPIIITVVSPICHVHTNLFNLKWSKQNAIQMATIARIGRCIIIAFHLSISNQWLKQSYYFYNETY